MRPIAAVLLYRLDARKRTHLKLKGRTAVTYPEAYVDEIYPGVAASSFDDRDACERSVQAQ